MALHDHPLQQKRHITKDKKKRGTEYLFFLSLVMCPLILWVYNLKLMFLKEVFQVFKQHIEVLIKRVI